MPSFPERQFSGESLDSIPARLQSVSNHCQVFGAARGRRKGDELPKSAAALRMIRFCASAEQTQAQTPDAARRRLQLQREHKDPGARDTNALTCGEAARFSVTNAALFWSLFVGGHEGSFLPLWEKAGVQLRPRFPSDMPLLREPRCKPLCARGGNSFLLRTRGERRHGRQGGRFPPGASSVPKQETAERSCGAGGCLEASLRCCCGAPPPALPLKSMGVFTRSRGEDQETEPETKRVMHGCGGEGRAPLPPAPPPPPAKMNNNKNTKTY